MKKLILSGVAVLALLAPTMAGAQVAWDSPMLMPPNPSDDFGIYLVDVHAGGVGVLGTWRSPGYNFVVREGQLGADRAFLPKPFSPNDLLRKVRDVIDA